MLCDDHYGDGCRESEGFNEDKGYEAKHSEDQRLEEPDFESPSYEDLCWMISRAPTPNH
ncbi:hypothetical protein VCR17J2_570001 [Vibrio coralliirubri]|nr:hypothetical protein VCR17J2_570001 [Vibrio coralliirubri]